MTVRPPRALSPNFSTAGAFNVLEYELMSERADALGRHGLKVEKALAALAALDGDVGADQRERILDETADAETLRLGLERRLGSLANTAEALLAALESTGVAGSANFLNFLRKCRDADQTTAPPRSSYESKEGLAECVATAKSFGNHIAERSARVKNLENTVFERSATHFSKEIIEDERSATLF